MLSQESSKEVELHHSEMLTEHGFADRVTGAVAGQGCGSKLEARQQAKGAQAGPTGTSLQCPCHVCGEGLGLLKLDRGYGATAVHGHAYAGCAPPVKPRYGAPCV